jgi:hypothetical protein
MRVGAVLAVVLMLACGADAASTFTPRTLAGTWTGGWSNDVLGDSGPAQIVARSLAGNTKLVFSVNFGGGVFGCSSVPPESTPPIPHGIGVNHWNAHGFVLKGRSKDFGAMTLRYRAPSGNVTASGVDPPCAPGLSWSMIGAFVGSTFSGKVKIRLAGGRTSIGDINLTRS